MILIKKNRKSSLGTFQYYISHLMPRKLELKNLIETADKRQDSMNAR